MRTILNILVLLALLIAVFFVYLQYSDVVKESLFGQETYYTIYLGEVPVFVTVADTPESRSKGLSGVSKLETNQGKLFVFEQSAKHGIWMKDMLMPIDIVWINDQLRIVDIKKQVQPDSFPAVYAPRTNARFVLEVNAFFVDSLKLSEGDTVFIPPEILPKDIVEALQQ